MDNKDQLQNSRQNMKSNVQGASTNGQDANSMEQDVNTKHQDANPLDRDRHRKLAKIANEDHTLDPYEIEFLPEFREGRGPQEPFVNEYGVIIGDHMYDSPESPLNQWSVDTDPEVMAGDHWVHPFKDIGFHTEENRDWFEKGIPPQGGMFMHPDKDVAYEANLEGFDGKPKDKPSDDHKSKPQE